MNDGYFIFNMDMVKVSTCDKYAMHRHVFNSMKELLTENRMVLDTKDLTIEKLSDDDIEIVLRDSIKFLNVRSAFQSLVVLGFSSFSRISFLDGKLVLVSKNNLEIEGGYYFYFRPDSYFYLGDRNGVAWYIKSCDGAVVESFKVLDSCGYILDICCILVRRVSNYIVIFYRVDLQKTSFCAYLVFSSDYDLVHVYCGYYKTPVFSEEWHKNYGVKLNLLYGA